MPLRSDPAGGGTEADGSASPKFCSFCYSDGRFVRPEMTFDEMRARCVDKMREMGFPRFLGRMFSARLRKLERWSS